MALVAFKDGLPLCQLHFLRSPTVIKVCQTYGEFSSTLDEVSPSHMLISPTLSEASRYRDTIQSLKEINWWRFARLGMEMRESNRPEQAYYQSVDKYNRPKCMMNRPHE
ncbi:hypothetical protein [Sporosarcina sp. SAFN-010]|uniref:hypothetical protein n=1 Tax=Sporosarcina sp. SAFN-010 TaxID=3387273 RepID=UPI003F7F2105